MKYQLVLQFRGGTLADFDEIIAFEDRLIEVLGKSAKVDGHDCGSGETNIFIFTSDPKATFLRVRQTLEGQGKLESVTVACRLAGGDDYTVLWPENSKEEFKVA